MNICMHFWEHILICGISVQCLYMFIYDQLPHVLVKCCPKWLVLIYTYTSHGWEFHVLCIFVNTWYYQNFQFSYFIWCMVISNYDFDFDFLCDTWSWEHFVCLLVIWIFLLMGYFFVLICWPPLYNLRNTILIQGHEHICHVILFYMSSFDL